MSGKKSKKEKKTKTVSLDDFLGNTPKTATSWADSIDDDDDYPSSRREPVVVLPTAPRAARDHTIDEDTVPTNPPYIAYISNLPYDIEEEDLEEFFQDMSISCMRLPKEQDKFKGYGYMEFRDRKSLIDALSMVDTNLKGRRVRIELSTQNDRPGRMGRMGERSGRDYGGDPERTTGDWRSARAGDAGGDGTDGGGGGGRDDRYRPRGGGGGFERRGGDDERRGERGGGFEDSKWRDGPRENLSDRSGGGSGRPSFRDGNRGGGGGGEERDWNRFADRGRSNFNRDGSRERDGGDRGGGDRGGFGPRRNYGNSEDAERDKERWGNLRNRPREPLGREPRETDDDAPASAAAAAEAPKERPRLQLQARTKPIPQSAPSAAPPAAAASSEGDASAESSSTEAEAKAAGDGSDDVAATAESGSGESKKPAAAAVPAANIFGAARPVDTAAREREIEERMAKSAEAAAAKAKEEAEKRAAAAPPKEPAWGRRNGEGRDDKADDKSSSSTTTSSSSSSRPAWRSSEDRNGGGGGGRFESRGPPRDYRDSRDRGYRDGQQQQQQRDNQRDFRDVRAGEREGFRDKERRGPPRQLDARGPAPVRQQQQAESHRPPPEGAEREKKVETEEEELRRMPKAKDDQAPNFVASNKYSMLPDDVDPDSLIGG